VLNSIIQGPSWSCLYGCWIYNYLCNQCLSLLKLWVQIPLRRGITEILLKVALNTITLILSYSNDKISSCSHIWPKENICVFTVTCQKKSRVGRSGLIFFFFFFFFIIGKTGNSRSGIRFRYFIFEISGKMTKYAVFLPSLLSISTKS
jgi:hypothetical protein